MVLFHARAADATIWRAGKYARRVPEYQKTLAACIAGGCGGFVHHQRRITQPGVQVARLNHAGSQIRIATALRRRTVFSFLWFSC